MEVVVCRSTIEIVEEALLKITQHQYNISRDDACRLGIQRREVGRAQRVEAEALIEAWEGSTTQINRVYQLIQIKDYEVSKGR